MELFKKKWTCLITSVIKQVQWLMVPAFCIAALVIQGCASKPPAVPEAPKTPTQKTELLDWKNAGLGVAVPEWVMAQAQNDVQIQKLADFKGQFCFVVYREDENQDMATQWANNSANGAAEVARIISTTATNKALAQEGMKSGDEARHQATEEIREAMSNCSFKGLRRASDFWVLNKNAATGREYYTAYSLWTIAEKELNEQLAAQYANIIGNNKAMSEAERSIYLDLITSIRERGLDAITS
jgi:hypothetical protein